jgi:hypothetical protein
MGVAQGGVFFLQGWFHHHDLVTCVSKQLYGNRKITSKNTQEVNLWCADGDT